MIGLLGINLYLQSTDVQQRIRYATEDAIGAPVSVRSTTYTPWSGLTLSGLTVPAWVGTAPNLFEAARFSVRFEIFPLFQRRFVIREVTLDRPVFSLRQSQSGVWTTRAPEEEGPRIIPEIVIDPEPQIVPPVAEATPVPPVEIPPTERPESVPYEIELRKVRVVNGSIILTNNRGRPALVVSDFRMTGTMDSTTSGSGTFSASIIDIGETLKPRNLTGNFAFEGGHAYLTNIRTDLADGWLQTEIELSGLDSSQPEFALELEGDEISIPRLLVEAAGEAVGASGTATVKLALSGNLALADTIAGGGRLELNDARMQPVDFIRQIGSLLRIDELQMLDLAEATLDVSVASGRVNVDRLYLQSDNLIIAAEGPIKFDGSLDLDARLLLNTKLQRQLRAVLSRNFEPSEDADYRQVTFDITGTMARPETNLVERMTGIQIGSFGGLLRGLLQPPRQQEREENEEAN